MDPKNVKDIEDLAAELDELRRLSNSFNLKFIGLGLEYQNKISGKSSNNYFAEIRSSLSHRLLSCEYLFNLLNSIHGSAFNSRSFDEHASHRILGQFGPEISTAMTTASVEGPCLFDCIIYNLTSTFDYLGGLIELICGGQGRNRLKWNPLVNALRTGISPLIKSEARYILLKGHEDFVDKLYRYRSEIIHDTAVVGAFDLAIDNTQTTNTLQLFVPLRFATKFAELKMLSSNNRITLRYTSLFLLKRTINFLIEVLLRLRIDVEVNRKLPAGKETLLFKDASGNLTGDTDRFWT